MKSWQSAALALLLAFAAQRTAFAQTALHETEAKAAAVYSFLHYVEWPAAKANGTLELCLVGDPASLLLTDQFQGQPIKVRTLNVRVLDDKLAGLQRCEAVFVDSGNPHDLQRVASYARNRPVLVIAEGGPALLPLGATIAVTTTGGKVSFSVSLEAARAAGLNISSKLLRLARTVIE